MATSSPHDVESSTTYFGYGSNLWLYQMKQRCPTSKYRGVARLNNYKWIISERGYANIVEQSESTGTGDKPVVYALVYDLLPKDESRLDRNEGVPVAYTKEYLEVDFWEGDLDTHGGWVDVSKKATKKKALVYINRKQVTEGTSKEEYVHRMNEGIADAVKVGVPQEYIDKFLRKFIPKELKDDDDESRELAQKQALSFEDENLSNTL